jgi:hypothetical protein
MISMSGLIIKRGTYDGKNRKQGDAEMAGLGVSSLDLG